MSSSLKPLFLLSKCDVESDVRVLSISLSCKSRFCTKLLDWIYVVFLFTAMMIRFMYTYKMDNLLPTPLMGRFMKDGSVFFVM